VLAVFAGGCDYETAEEVCGADPDTIQSLIDKSLLRRRESTTGPRYWMLETIHDNAVERLDASDEAAEVHRAHARWFVELAERLAPSSAGGDEKVRRLERLDAERDNLRAAFAWAIGNATREAARIVLALGQYWYVRGAFSETADSVAAVLERADELDPPDVGRIRNLAGQTAFHLSDVDAAEAQLEQALGLVGGLPVEVEVLRHLGYVSEVRQDWQAAIEFQEQALAAARSHGDPSQIRTSLHALGSARAGAGDLRGAREVAEEGVALGLEAEDDLFISHAAHNLGDFALRIDDLDEATDQYGQAARAGRRVGSTRAVAYCLAGLAAVAARRGERERAARLWGAVTAFEDQSLRLLAHERSLYKEILDEAAGEHQFAYETGRTLALDDALEEALGQL
jgi:tetratricopeptide (TPR) repeat protein